MLDRCRAGDDAARNAVFESLYPELKRLAASKLFVSPSGGAITPTVLVHDVFVRMIGNQRLDLVSRHHFFASAAKAMRHILVDRARRASAEKRGGRDRRVTFTEGLASEFRGATWLDLDRALDELARVDARAHRIVELRFFAGLTADDTAEMLEISTTTLHRDWQRARAFLHTRMDSSTEAPA